MFRVNLHKKVSTDIVDTNTTTAKRKLEAIEEAIITERNTHTTTSSGVAHECVCTGCLLCAFFNATLHHTFNLLNEYNKQLNSYQLVMVLVTLTLFL